MTPWQVCEEILIWRSTIHSDAFRRKCEKLRKSQMKRELRGFVVERRAIQYWKGFCAEFANRIKVSEKNWFFAFGSLLKYMALREISDTIENLIFLAGPYTAVSSRKQKISFFQKFYSIRKVHAKTFPTLGRTSFYDKNSQFSLHGNFNVLWDFSSCTSK